MKNKILNLSLIIIACLLLLGIGCKKTTKKPTTSQSADSKILVEDTTELQKPKINPETGFAIYENDEFGTKIEYPSDWQQQDNAFGSLVMFYSPQSNGEDPFRENLNIIAASLGGTELELYDYMNANIEQLENSLIDFEFFDVEEVEINTIPGRKVTYTGTIEGNSLKWTQWYILKSDKAFVITYTGQDEFDTYLKTAQDIVNTLEIN